MKLEQKETRDAGAFVVMCERRYKRPMRVIPGAMGTTYATVEKDV
jgi:hypothetical protein